MGKKNRNINDKPGALIAIGLLFLLPGIALIISYFLVKNFPILVVIVGAVFAAVGLFIFIFGILRTKTMKKYKALLNDPNAYTTDATFIRSRFSSMQGSSVSVGFVTAPISADIYKKIIYSYTDQNGQHHEVKSIMSFVPNQVRYLEQKGTFKIKCDGAVSAVIEELPDISATFNL